jgi:hypothetical protein
MIAHNPLGRKREENNCVTITCSISIQMEKQLMSCEEARSTTFNTSKIEDVEHNFPSLPAVI